MRDRDKPVMDAALTRDEQVALLVALAQRERVLVEEIDGLSWELGEVQREIHTTLVELAEGEVGDAL